MTSEPTITCIDEGWVIDLPFDPVPAARPKVGRWNTYYPKTYANWKKKAEQGLARVVPTWRATNEPVYTSVEVVKQKAKTSKLLTPGGDIDNYAKAAFDAITKCGHVWEDDKQVQTLYATKRFTLGDEDPYTRVVVGLTMGVVWLEINDAIRD